MTTRAFTLSAQERAHLQHPVDDDVEMLALPVPRGSAQRLAEVAGYLQERAGGAQEVAGLLERVEHVPAAGTAAALTRVEHRWRDLAGRHGLLTGPEVADLAGSRAKNRSEHASALARQGRVLSIRRAGRALYPGFQLGPDGAPLAVVAQVLAVLREASWSDESIALWCDAPNGYLDDRRPADLLADESEQVVLAARHTADRSAW